MQTGSRAQRSQLLDGIAVATIVSACATLRSSIAAHAGRRAVRTSANAARAPWIAARASAVALAIAAIALPAAAGQYPARGDTGWIHTAKRECCNDAIARALTASTTSCENAGGAPAPPRGGVERRGSCTWESAVDDDGVIIFRCQAEASVGCG